MIWLFRVFMYWLAIGLMAFLAALFVDELRGVEIGVAYLKLYRKATLVLVMLWPWAFWLLLREMSKGD